MQFDSEGKEVGLLFLVQLDWDKCQPRNRNPATHAFPVDTPAEHGVRTGHTGCDGVAISQ